MKKLNYFLLGAAGLVLASCSQEDLVSNTGSADGTATVSINLSTPQIQTRAISDGTTANKLYWSVYEKTSDGLKRLDATGYSKVDGEDFYLEDTKTFKLIDGRSYGFVFWAANESSPYTVTFTSTGATMTADYSNVICNDERLDAFFAYEELTVKGDVQLDVPMFRPFAQINIGTNDFQEAADINYEPKTSTILNIATYTGLDLVSGEKIGNKVYRTFKPGAIPTTYKFPVDGYDYLATTYILLGLDKENISVNFDYSSGDGDSSHQRNVYNVPVERNHRTNIYGQILTSNAELKVFIEPDYLDPDLEPSQLELIAGLGGTVVLEDDFDINNTKKSRITFVKDAIVDMNGKKVTGSNLNNDNADGTFLVTNGANLTIKGDGVMETSGNYGTILVWSVDGSVTIEDGTFISHPTNGEMIYAGNYDKTTEETWGGAVYIKGGTFKCGQPKWTLNCQDNAFQAGKAYFVVTGGKFWNYNPAEAYTEPEPDQPISWVPKGYKVVKSKDEEGGDNDYWYTVLPDETIVLESTVQNKAFSKGGDFFLSDDVTVEDNYVALTKDSNIDLNGKSLGTKKGGQYGDTMVIGNGANVTVKNGEIKPAEDASAAAASASILVKTSSASHVTLEDVTVSGIHPIYLNSANEGSTVTILSGNYCSSYRANDPTQEAPAVYVGKGTPSTSTIGGKVTIYGGTFGAPGYVNNFLLNVEDVLRKQEGKEPRNFIEVFGGTFINFNPADNKAEGEGTNFVANGYDVVSEQVGNDIYYTVVKR